MPSMTLARTDAIVGVDTHKDRHVAVAVDGLGGRLAEQVVPATTAGYAQLHAWAAKQGRVVARPTPIDRTGRCPAPRCMVPP